MAGQVKKDRGESQRQGLSQGCPSSGHEWPSSSHSGTATPIDREKKESLGHTPVFWAYRSNFHFALPGLLPNILRLWVDLIEPMPMLAVRRASNRVGAVGDGQGPVWRCRQ